MGLYTLMLHLMHILEIEHLDVDGTVLWRDEWVPNLFHRQGQQFLLSVGFNLASTVVVPTNYYLGLDARNTISDTDTLASISGEPNTSGYSRQPVSSLNGFSIALGANGKYRAVSNSVTFSASGGTWGPVTNLFLTDVPSGTGYLISSSALRAPRTVASGQSITMRVVVSLGN